jgi:hypothetical protein
MLGTFYRTTLPRDSDLLAAWNSARNVVDPFHHRAVAPAPVSPVVPPVPGGMAVAA